MSDRKLSFARWLVNLNERTKHHTMGITVSGYLLVMVLFILNVRTPWLLIPAVGLAVIGMVLFAIEILASGYKKQLPEWKDRRDWFF
jgi:hypothetical protein